MASICNAAYSTYPWSNTFAGENIFGANPWTTFGANMPSTTFGANPWTTQFPSTNVFGANFPSTFGANVPSTFGGNYFNAPSTFGANVPSWTRHALPCEYRDMPSRPLSIVEYQSLQNPIYINQIDGSRLLHVTFDVKGFKPEEIKVEVIAKERAINVECKTESKVEKEHEVKRSYTRKFVIPEYYACDLTKCEIKSHVTADGLLIVESALPRLSVEELKNLKEKVPTSKSTPFVGASMYSCGPVVSIPLKTVA